MKSKLLLLLLLLGFSQIQAQLDTQKRFQSDTRKYYVWNTDFQKYELVETEYEHSIIDIREIGSKTNGYIVISMVDNGQVRMHHGSIYNFTKDNENEGSWSIQSKFMRARLIYNPKENTMTYMYDSSDKRYKKLMVFTVAPDELPDANLKSVVKMD
ncbi:hypothetical protein [Flavobacterium sp.]|jgi:hypothetical protein|uniref:hypothetical protein n=1 Tax=Flavobacterium sp. TaxID=239 RepID=UPI00378501B9